MPVNYPDLHQALCMQAHSLVILFCLFFSSSLITWKKYKKKKQRRSFNHQVYAYRRQYDSEGILYFFYFSGWCRQTEKKTRKNIKRRRKKNLNEEIKNSIQHFCSRSNLFFLLSSVLKFPFYNVLLTSFWLFFLFSSSSDFYLSMKVSLIFFVLSIFGL